MSEFRCLIVHSSRADQFRLQEDDKRAHQLHLSKLITLAGRAQLCRTSTMESWSNRRGALEVNFVKIHWRQEPKAERWNGRACNLNGNLLSTRSTSNLTRMCPHARPFHDLCRTRSTRIISSSILLWSAKTSCNFCSRVMTVSIESFMHAFVFDGKEDCGSDGNMPLKSPRASLKFDSPETLEKIEKDADDLMLLLHDSRNPISLWYCSLSGGIVVLCMSPACCIHSVAGGGPMFCKLQFRLVEKSTVLV
ncbi:hypothetical protein BKA63DRAFT_226386 [Paraphoma chrysanthemicola]|nr:hypothetical protein BKA63DRAFT_226386 [Paraphoma chrysanthemicola]